MEATIVRIQTLRDQAAADGDDPALWTKALAAADQALVSIGDLLTSAPGRRLASLRAKVAEDKEQAERDGKFVAELARVRTTRGLPTEHPDDRYAKAFKRYGLELTRVPVDQVIARLKSRPENVRRQAVEFLDDWAFERGASGGEGARALTLARGLDSDPERNRLRSLLDQPDLRRQIDDLRTMTKEPGVNNFAPSTSLLLALALEKAGDKSRAIAVLRAAIVRNPGDLWLNLELAQRLDMTEPPQTAEAIRYFSVAPALRPASGNDLARLLAAQGKEDEAEAILRELVRLQPSDVSNWRDLCSLLQRHGRADETRRVLGRWIDWLRLEPNASLGHLEIAFVMRFSGDGTAELAELREAARLDPTSSFIQRQLGHTLHVQGDSSAAIKALRKAIRLDPGNVTCYYELAFLLCRTGDHTKETSALRKAIELKTTARDNGRPELPADAHASVSPSVMEYYYLTRDHGFVDEFLWSYDQGNVALGNALAEMADFPGAIAAYRDAIRLKERGEVVFSSQWFTTTSTSAAGPLSPRYALCQGLAAAGDFRGEIAEACEAIRLQPKLAPRFFGFSLCLALARSGDFSTAIAEFRNVISSAKTNPPEIFQMLGPIAVSHRSEDTVKALSRLREGARGDPALVEWINRVITLTESILRLGGRIPRIFQSGNGGFPYPLTCHYHRFYAAAANLWSAAFDLDPTLATDMDAENRYNAACGAALAGCGCGRDSPPPDEDEKAKLRLQVIDWLRADLAYWSKQAASIQPESKARLRGTLERWKTAPISLVSGKRPISRSSPRTSGKRGRHSGRR